MKIFGYNISRTKPEQRSESLSAAGLNWSSYGSYLSSKALTLSAVYRATNLISDSIASLQMKIYSIDDEGFKKEDVMHPLYSILGVQPNSYMSRYNFFKLIITSLHLRGNAYIKINRKNSIMVDSLEFLNPDAVTISTVGGQIKYMVNGVSGYIDDADMIHVLNMPQIGSLYGVSTITYAANSLEIAYSSEESAKSFFQNGSNFSAIATMAPNITPKQEQDIQTKMKNNPNGVVILGGVPDFKLNTLGVSPKDSQLLETRQYNVVDIARFFNVDPILLYDSTKGTYSNVENAQLAFLNNSLLSVIEKLENEFSRKLILPSQRDQLEIRFDVSNILRTDMASRSAYYKALFELGVVSPNQIAKELNLPKVEGTNGDEHFISTNLQKLNELVVDMDNSVDNKLK